MARNRHEPGKGPKDWSPRVRKLGEPRTEEGQELAGWLRSSVVLEGDGTIDLDDDDPVYVAVIHDGSGFNPAAMIAVGQNRYHNLESDLLETAFDMMRERDLKNEVHVKELQEEWGEERWEEILTEAYDGKVWKIQDPFEAARAILTDKRASQVIDIEGGKESK